MRPCSVSSKPPISHWTAGRFCDGCLGGGAGSMSQGLRVLVLVPNAGGAASLWDHNGSVVSLEATGNVRKFYYKVPRSNLPATEGALLFEGERVGNSFIGTAYVFSTKCDPRGYAVRGFVTNNDQKIVMRGKAPPGRRKLRCEWIP